MEIYPLYLESGPRRRRTMVHVLPLLGCTVSAATTDEALAASGEAIRNYLAWLRRAAIVYASPTRADSFPHADDPFRVVVAEHITTGYFLGNGSPAVTFTPELEPLGSEELRLYIERLEWQRADLLALLRDCDADQLDARPEQGRSLREILMHIAEADLYFAGTITSVPSPRRLVRRDAHVFEKLSRIRAVVLENLAVLSEDERARVNQQGKQLWTARKALRRCLEHEYEHLREISRRVSLPMSVAAGE
jgi:uncharacterized damage-inducible protein DinB